MLPAALIKLMMDGAGRCFFFSRVFNIHQEVYQFESAPKLRKAMVTIPARWLIRKALANLRSPNRTTGASLQAKHALHDRLSRKNLEKNSFLTFLVPKKKNFNPLRKSFKFQSESEIKSHFKSLNSKALFRVYTPEN